ncbi:hypothetical protein CDAR_616451 [Caerostris darwini]|uniref:Uncharacterized protein n=1 Tax=Caerostris darwini TaxID=1538125 RepID=A0AAV4VKV5_9ARAC|nr:hypothetical protein CDAR_616451 [Caerostris darwini]
MYSEIITYQFLLNPNNSFSLGHLKHYIIYNYKDICAGFSISSKETIMLALEKISKLFSAKFSMAAHCEIPFHLELTVLIFQSTNLLYLSLVQAGKLFIPAHCLCDCPNSDVFLRCLTGFLPDRNETPTFLFLT